MVIHQIIEGVDGGITGKGNDQTKDDDSQWRERSIPEQSGESGSGHVQ
jgi:hypothetical protein